MRRSAAGRPASWWLAWSIVAVTVLLGSAIVVMSFAVRDFDYRGRWPPALDVVAAAAAVATAVVGALVVTRRPNNPVGWLLLAMPVLNVVGGAAEAYGAYTLFIDRGILPGGALAAWLSAWVAIPALVGTPALLLLLFPDGRPPGRRWRWVVGLAVLSTLAATADAMLTTVLDDAPFTGMANPTPLQVPEAVLAPISNAAWPGMLAGLLLAAAGMVRRLRRARGIMRRQLEWVAAAAAVLPPIMLAGVIFYYLGQDIAGSFVVTLASLPIPLAAGYAILRHRLFDVELVIKRALVYATATALLALCYAAFVLLLQGVLDPLTGDSSIAVALSTLAVAVLFRPVLRRAQTLIDRRFFRNRYDAVRTLETFGTRLRGQTDIEALRNDLQNLVRTTLRPAHVSLWLRDDEPARPGGVPDMMSAGRGGLEQPALRA